MLPNNFYVSTRDLHRTLFASLLFGIFISCFIFCMQRVCGYLYICLCVCNCIGSSLCGHKSYSQSLYTAFWMAIQLPWMLLALLLNHCACGAVQQHEQLTVPPVVVLHNQHTIYPHVIYVYILSVAYIYIDLVFLFKIIYRIHSLLLWSVSKPNYVTKRNNHAL